MTYRCVHQFRQCLRVFDIAIDEVYAQWFCQRLYIGAGFFIQAGSH